MAVAASCPDRALLERLMLGQVPGTQGEALARHLEQCASCLAIVRELRAEDTLVEAARAPSTVKDDPEADAVRTLIARLRQQPPRLAKSSDSEATTFVESPDSLQQLGPYRVEGVLGSGGMGIVYRAEDTQLRRTVALKVMKREAANKPAARQRFLREARAAAALDHEHVVTIYQVGEENDVPYLAMQWLKGMSLADRLKQKVPLTLPQVLQLGKQIALGLAAAHERGLVHRDVKPANVWLEELSEGAGPYHVKLLDFGLARPPQDDSHLTQTGDIVGTPAYMPPEQARGEAVDPRGDLFSLGVVLYQMATGKLPFDGPSTMAVLTALATAQPRSLLQIDPSLPPALNDLVMRLLAKDPAARPTSAREVADRLNTIEQPSRSADRTRTPWRLLVAAAVLVALGSLAYFFGSTLVRIATNKGELVVAVDDPNVEIAIKQGGVIVHDRTTERDFVLTAGEGEIEVYEKASGMKLTTKKFTLTRGQKEYVQVTLDVIEKKRLDEHGVAVWVVSIGGEVHLRKDGQLIIVRKGEELPAEPFRVVGVSLFENKRVRDDDLAKLKKLKDLVRLDLNFTEVGDAGLEHLKGLKVLGILLLSGTNVTDNGLKHLKGLPYLSHLDLNDTQITDDGLEQLKRIPTLSILYLYKTMISDAGLASLKDLKNLTDLDLNNTNVSDEGLEQLKKLTKLRILLLSGTKISSAGLKHLQGLKDLRQLDLRGTKIAPAALEDLRQALPQCEVKGPK
jgi:tRNA A-37 threonylcarbamoyl transferase component Bud32